ncbi:MAG: DUF1629 domain-containing protein [Glutamicibacter sp.]|uniref:imm11 family protein n=1 Tax=Bacteria TaxID=2 RepID=UPI002FC77797
MSLSTTQRSHAALSLPKRGQFFLFGPEMVSGARSYAATFENIQQLLPPSRHILRPETGGFPPLPESPRLTFNECKGPLPRDLEGEFSGYWLVSDRLRQVMLAVDGDAFEFVECDTRWADGSKGPVHFLCDVVRELDALNEDTSRLRIKVSEDYARGKFYSLGGGARLAFRPGVLGCAHVFLTPFNPFAFCDASFRDAVRAAGVPIDPGRSGIWFVDAADI